MAEAVGGAVLLRYAAAARYTELRQLAGPATLGGAILSAVLLVTLPAVFTARAVTEWQPVAFGVMAIALAQAPNGLAGLIWLPDFSALSRASAWRRRTTGSRLGERVAARAGAS